LFGSISTVAPAAPADASTPFRLVDQGIDIPAPQCGAVNGKTICLQGGIRP
jgi:hypothetical protein